MKDDDLYSQVADEINTHQLVRGTWARAFAKAGGNHELAKAHYIEFRVNQIKEERDQKESARRKAEFSRAKDKVVNRVGMCVKAVLIIVLCVFVFVVIEVGLLALLP